MTLSHFFKSWLEELDFSFQAQNRPRLAEILWWHHVWVQAVTNFLFVIFALACPPKKSRYQEQGEREEKKEKKRG